eukprot:762424-Hanusia_phi.AAC.5
MSNLATSTVTVAAVGGLYSATTAAMEAGRGKEDVTNHVVGACASGAAIGARYGSVKVGMVACWAVQRHCTCAQGRCGIETSPGNDEAVRARADVSLGSTWESMTRRLAGLIRRNPVALNVGEQTCCRLTDFSFCALVTHVQLVLSRQVHNNEMYLSPWPFLVKTVPARAPERSRRIYRRTGRRARRQ